MGTKRSWSVTRVANAQGRTTGHYCLSVALGIAVLKSGRAIERMTSGYKGLVRVALNNVNLTVWISGDRVLQTYVGTPSGYRAAIEHFISLVGEKAAFKAIQTAASLATPFDVECVVAERPTRHEEPVEKGRTKLGLDRLSYGYLRSGKSRSWRFIARYNIDDTGGTRSGVDLHPVGMELEDATEQFLTYSLRPF